MWHHLEEGGKKPIGHITPFSLYTSLNASHDDSTAKSKGVSYKGSMPNRKNLIQTER